jgi:O-antigen/teichoic acid export membrane protein
MDAWLLAAATVPLVLTYELLLLHTRLLRRKMLFALGAVSNCLLSAATGVIAILWFDQGVKGVLTGTIVGTGVGVLTLAWGLRGRIQPCIDRVLLTEMLHYSAPLIPGWWLAFGSAYLSRFFVYGQLGPADNAVLAVALKLAGVVGLFVGAFQMAWQPLAMAQIGTEAGGLFYVRSMRLYVAAGTLAVFWLTAGLDPLLRLLAPDSYGGVAQLFPVFAVAMLVSGFANNLQLGHQIAKRTAWISISAFLAFVVNLGVMVWLTPVFGLAAAGWAMLAGFVVKVCLVYFTAQARHFIPYDRRAFLLFGAGTAGLIWAGSLSSDEIWSSLWSACVVFISGGVLASFIAGRGELSEFRHWLAASRKRSVS